MKTIEAYEAFDGRLFYSEEEAKEYEAEQVDISLTDIVYDVLGMECGDIALIKAIKHARGKRKELLPLAQTIVKILTHGKDR